MSNLVIIMIRIVEITTSTNDFPLTLIEYARFLLVGVCGLCTFLLQFPSMSGKEKSIQLKCTFSNCSLQFFSAWTSLRVSLGNCLVFLARPKLTFGRKRKPSLAKSKEITRGFHCLIRISFFVYRSIRVTLFEYCSIRVTLFENRSIWVTLFEYCSKRVTLFEAMFAKGFLFEKI